MKAFALAAIFAISSTAGMAQEFMVSGMPDGYLNLRAGPGTDRAVKGRLSPGDMVINLDRKGAWIRVQNRHGDFGWVHSKYLAF